jgi:NDP-sugar pyrophosphorylase family protein
MKAMILAAGLGTRLRPLTDDRPKALVEVAGRTLLEITLLRLRSFGVRQVIVNVHHFAEMIVDYLKAHDNFDIRIEISREKVLLDTGGGLKKASWFFFEEPTAAEEPFILHNVDVLSSIDLMQMVEAHNDKQALATLAVQKRESSRLLLFDDTLHLCGRRISRDQKPELVQSYPRKAFQNTLQEGTASAVPKSVDNSAALAPEVGLQELAFTGIHVISPRLLRMMREERAFSIIDAYLRLAGQGENILGFRADEYYWRDLGKPEQVRQAAEDYRQKLFS